MSDPTPTAPNPSDVTGEDLLESLTVQHEIRGSCPGCGEPIAHCGITQLAYTFEVCGCGAATYEHLTERVWHLACLNPAAPDLAAIEMLRSAAYTLGRFKTSRPAAEHIEAFLATRQQEDTDVPE